MSFIGQETGGKSTLVEIPTCFTRLRPSKLHVGGVGVFAILPIKKRTLVLATQQGVGLGRASAEQIKKMPRAVRKMYTDFAMQTQTGYQPPEDFTQMGMLWYICHSIKPNCKYTEDGYVSLRKIKTGEELSVDYRVWDKDFSTHVGNITKKKKI